VTARLKWYGIEASARRKVAVFRGRFMVVLINVQKCLELVTYKVSS